MSANRPPRLRRFKPFRNSAGTVLGFASIELASGLIINDVKLMVGPQGRRWIGVPVAIGTRARATARPSS